MATSTLTDQVLSATWVDLTVALPSIASADVTLQNVGKDPIAVVFGGSDPSAANKTGKTLGPRESVCGNAANVWARGQGNGSRVAVVLGSIAGQVQGNVASGSADAGNPVKVGASVVAGAPASVYSAGQVGNLFMDSYGGLKVVPGEAITATDGNLNNGMAGFRMTGNWGPLLIAPVVYNGATWDRQRGDKNGIVVTPGLSSTYWNYAGAAGGIVSSTADVAVKAAAGAGVRNFLGSIQIAHDVLGAVTEFVIKDGATIIHRGKLQTAAIDSAGGAGTITFDPPLMGSVNTALNFALLTSTTGGVFVNAQGFTGS